MSSSRVVVSYFLIAGLYSAYVLGQDGTVSSRTIMIKPIFFDLEVV